MHVGRLSEHTPIVVTLAAGPGIDACSTVVSLMGQLSLHCGSAALATLQAYMWKDIHVTSTAVQCTW